MQMNRAANLFSRCRNNGVPVSPQVCPAGYQYNAIPTLRKSDPDDRRRGWQFPAVYLRVLSQKRGLGVS